MVPEVEVLLHVDDVGNAVLVVFLQQLQNFHFRSRHSCKPNDWLV